MAAIYEQLCPVLFGDNAVGDMAKRIAEEGHKHVFICCDAGVRKAGIVALVEDALKAEGLTYSMYDEILPDTPDEVVDELAEKIRQTGADIILGVGGGSTMDAARHLPLFWIMATRSASIWKRTGIRDLSGRHRSMRSRPMQEPGANARRCA